MGGWSYKPEDSELSELSIEDTSTLVQIIDPLTIIFED